MQSAPVIVLPGTPFTREDDGEKCLCWTGRVVLMLPPGSRLPLPIHVDTLWISSACRYDVIVFSGRAVPGLRWMR